MRVETIGNATLYLGDARDILPTLGKVDAVKPLHCEDSPSAFPIHRTGVSAMTDDLTAGRFIAAFLLGAIGLIALLLLAAWVVA